MCVVYRVRAQFPSFLFGSSIFLGPPRRENTVLRSNLPPTSVYVIPNAIVADHFHPPSSRPPTDTSPYSRLCPLMSTYSDPHTHAACTVTIIVISRLAYRKGVDLLVAIAPRICAAFPNVGFVVGVYFMLSCDFSHYGIISSSDCIRWRRTQNGRPPPNAGDPLLARSDHSARPCGPQGRAFCTGLSYRSHLEVQTRHSAGSSTGLYLSEYFPHGGFRYCDT